MKHFFSFLILLHTLANARVLVPVEEISAAKAGVQAMMTATAIGTLNHQGNLGKALEDLGKPKALKSIATAIATAGLIGPAPEGGVFSADFAENLASHGAQHLSYGLKAGAISFAINGGSAKDALKTAGLLAVANAVQASVANELGVLRKEGLDSFTHKLGHGLAGAAAGAILDTKNPGKGAASGAIGAVVGEVVAESLPQTLSRENRADVGKLAAASAALLTKQEVDIAYQASNTALQNNFLFFAAPVVPAATAAAVAVGAVVVDKVVGVAMTAYDAYQAYLEEGAAGAAKSLATDGAIGLVAGGTAKVLFKGGKHLAKKGMKAAQSAMKPQTVIGKISTSTISKDLVKQGRSGRQARLKELASDPKIGMSDRGWIRQEMNSIERKSMRISRTGELKPQKNIRTPPGKELAHKRGKPAKDGYNYNHTNLQGTDLHKLQHKHEGYK